MKSQVDTLQIKNIKFEIKESTEKKYVMERLECKVNMFEIKMAE